MKHTVTTFTVDNADSARTTLSLIAIMREYHMAKLAELDADERHCRDILTPSKKKGKVCR